MASLRGRHGSHSKTGPVENDEGVTGIERAILRKLKQKDAKVPPWAKIKPNRIAVYNDIRPEMEKAEPEVQLTSLLAYNYWLRGVQTDAMRLINHLDMSAFRKQFQAQHGSVNLTTFIQIVRKIMGSKKGKERAAPVLEGLAEEEVTARLMELFREIDLDGDGLIVWEEFTTFVLDKATQVGQQAENGEREGKIFPYRPMRRPGAPQHHFKRKNPYECVVALAGRTVMAAVEHESSVIHFYDMRRHAAPIGCIRSRAKVLAMINLPHPINTFVTSHADMVMRTWNLDDGPSSSRWTMRTQWPLADNQQCLCYAASHNLLFSGATGGEISGWSVGERELKMSFTGHSDTVLDLISLADLDVLASGSSDTSVCIWDLHVGRLRQKLVGHQKGVVSLSFCPPQRLIVSGGYDHEAFVWSPFVSTLLHKLVGHAAPIMAVESVNDRPEVITGDSNGVVKLWDLRNYRCIQTFIADEGELTCQPVAAISGSSNTTTTSSNNSSGEDGLNLSCSAPVALSELDADGVAGIAQVPISRTVTRLAVATKRLNYFEQERATSHDVTDELPISAALFNEVCFTIVTAAGTNVKVWDAILGNIKASYVHVVKADITAMALDDRHRKILIGDVGGDVNVITHHSGTWMKSFQKVSDAAVVTIINVAGSQKQVLVAYADHMVYVYDESPIHACPALRSFTVEGDGAYLTAMAFSPHRCQGRGPYAATGCGRPNDAVALWSYAVGKCEASLTMDEGTNQSGAGRGQPSTLAITFLGESPLLAVSGSDGFIRVWTTWPMVGARRVCLLCFANQEPKAGYTFDGEEDELYPLLHRKGTGRQPVYPTRLTTKQYRHYLDDDGGKSGVGPAAMRPIPEDPREREWKAMPRLSSPRRKVPVPATCLAWEKKSCCLLTGDESGRIRRWDLSSLYECLEDELLLFKEGGKWRVTSLPAAATMSISEQLDFLEDAEARLVWSLEAHDDAITCLSLVDEPQGILSGSVDQCVKMWSMEGRPFGKLLQSVVSTMKNREWNLTSFDVESAIRKEDEAIHHVEEMVLLERQKHKALRAEVMDQLSTLSLEASTIATHPSIFTVDSHETYGSSSLGGASSSIMTTVSTDAHHQALMYLAMLDKDNIFSRKPQATPPKLHEISNHPHVMKHLQTLRMDMTLRAAAKIRNPYYGAASHFMFSTKKPTAADVGGDGKRKGGTRKERLQVALQSAASMDFAAVEPIRIPASPGRKDTMESDVEDAILALRRRLSYIDARGPPSLFPAQKSGFHDFAKDVLSPMISGENSTLTYSHNNNQPPVENALYEDSTTSFVSGAGQRYDG